MLEILGYPFFQRALAAVALISICAAVVGTYVITRRMVALSGGVTHACFGGLGLGYFLGVSPILTAGLFAVGSAAAVEWMSRRLSIREDSAIAVVWALGMAVGVLCVFLTPGYVPELNAFLFGNVLTVSDGDLLAFGIYAAVLLGFFFSFRKAIVACAFDRDFAKVSGLPTGFISYTMTMLVAIGIVLTIRVAGIMLLMSVLSLPMMAAETFSSRFMPIVRASICISLLCSLGGLAASAVADVPASALIVLLMGGVYIAARIVAAFRR
ncbi:MAG: metal ABC transporter permease [Muribaculaceae bacterium]|nr:metal ABC transporter permease [Muribaculaceae bacterium]